jgi:hypothetical protein
MIDGFKSIKNLLEVDPWEPYASPSYTEKLGAAAEEAKAKADALREQIRAHRRESPAEWRLADDEGRIAIGRRANSLMVAYAKAYDDEFQATIAFARAVWELLLPARNELAEAKRAEFSARERRAGPAELLPLVLRRQAAERKLQEGQRPCAEVEAIIARYMAAYDAYWGDLNAAQTKHMTTLNALAAPVLAAIGHGR